MKKQFIITLFLACCLIFISFHGVSAQIGATSVSGDEVCGASTSTKCTLTDAQNIVRNLLVKIIIPLGSALLVLFILYRFTMAWFALQAGNTGAYKEALKQSGNAVLGFIIVVAVIGGLYLGLLKFLGVKGEYLKLLFSMLATHAYAAEPQLLPNPLMQNDLYGFLLALVRLVIRWFIYPAVLVMWVWTGFAFVAAQGNPEKIKSARNWLLWALVTTVIIFVTEGFLFALRGTVNEILQ